MVQYRPYTARAGRFSQRAQWGLHLGIERHYNAWKIFDVHSKETVAARDVIFYERLTLQTYLDNLAANRDLMGGFRGNRAFASAADEADWDEKNVDNASEEAGPLPYCSVLIPMDDENPRESVNAETYFDFADIGYVTPQPIDTNISERIGPNFLPDPEAGDEAAYPEDTNLPRYTQSGLQILGLVTAVQGAEPPKEPATIQQALGGEHMEKWHEAMDRELKALQEHNTWKFVPIRVARNCYRLRTEFPHGNVFLGPTTNLFFLPCPKRILRLPHPAVTAATVVAAPTAVAAPAAVAAPVANAAPAPDAASAAIAALTAVTASIAFAAPAAVAALAVVAAPAVTAPTIATPAAVVALTAVTAPIAFAAPAAIAAPAADAAPAPRRPPEPRRPTTQHCPTCTALAATTAIATIGATAAIAAMASPTVLTFDAEGRAVDFDVWVDDLQLFLQCDSRDGVSLFDHTSGVSTSPGATADSTVCSKWTTRDAVARLAVRSHLPPAEHAHFGQYKTAKSWYDAVVARYSSPANAALNRLMLPYLLPDLAAFATVADLITHLRTSDARYRVALPTDFCAKNPPPPMYITLYYLVTRLPDSIASVRDHFLSLCPTELTVDLLEERLAAAEKSIIAVVGGAATAKARGARVVEGIAGAAAEAVEEAEGVAVEVGVVPGVGGFSGGGGGGGGSGGGGGGSGSGGGGSGSGGGGGGGGGAGRGAATQRGGFGGSQRQQQPRSRETPSAQQLREWYAGHGRQNVAIFHLDFDATYAVHQINLQPRVSLPETTPTLRWTGKVGDASAFLVWGSLAFVCDTSTDKLSSCAVPCVFLGFPANAPGWQFYHPSSRRVLSSQDVTFDESVSYYRLFPYRTASLPPPPLFLAPGTPPVDPHPPQGPAPSGVSQVDPAEPVEVAVDSGAARGAEPAGAGTGGEDPGGAEPECVEPGGAESGGAEPARAESGGSLGVPLRREPLSPQWLREWYTRRCCRAAYAGAAGGAAGAGVAGGAAGAGAAGGAAGAVAAGGAAGAGAAGGAAGVGAAGGAAGAGAAGAAAGAEAVGGPASVGAAGATVVTGDPGAEGTGAVSAVSGGAARPRPYYVPLLQQVLGLPPSPDPTRPLLSPPPVQSQSQLQPSSPLPSPSPYSGPTRGLTERREPESHPVSPESRPASPVCTVRACRVSRPRLPPVPGTHSMTLRPSTAPQRFPLPSPHASSLPDGSDPESDSLCAASPTIMSFLATTVTDPLFESSAASSLVAELVDFATACCLDYAASLVAEFVSASVCPPSVGGECALGTDVLEDKQEEFECFAAAVPHLVSMLLTPEGDPDAPDIPTPRSYAEAIEDPYFSQWQAAMDAKMASWVNRPPGSPSVFKAHYVGRGFSQRQGVDFFQTFSPTLKMTTLWLRRPPGFTGSFPAGTQWSLRRPVYGLRQAPREWHDTLRTTLATLGFSPSTADPSLFLRTDTTLLPFYVLVYVDDLVFATADTSALTHVKSELQKRHMCTDLGELTSYLGLRITRDRAQRTITLTQSHMVQQVLQRFRFTYFSPQSTPLPTGHSLSAPPSDESIEPSGPYPELVGCLMYLMTCTRPDLAYPLSLLARYVAPGRHRKVHIDAAKRVLRYLCNTSGMGLVLGGRARVVLTGHTDTSWADDLATQWSSQGYTFSLGSGSVSWRSTRSSSVLSSSC
ncbi:unnamed protein product [Closterium sp. NIES-53]